MANTQAMLATAVAGFMQRDPTSFVRLTGVVSPSLIPVGAAYDGSGHFALTGLNINGSYAWTKSTSDTNIQCSPVALTSSGTFVAIARSIILVGTASVAVTATLVATSTPFDLILQACNNARLYAERKIDFELSVNTVTIPAVDRFNGASLNTAVLYGTSTSANVKKIRTPFVAMANGHQFPVDLWTKKKWNDRLKARYEGARPTDTSDYACITDSPFVVVQDGFNIFVAPADSNSLLGTFPVYLDCWLWLPPYVNGTENDFLLDNCFDWMMYRCIYELNFFLKEDERVELSTKLMGDSWDAVIKWNDQLINTAVDDTDLD